MPSILSPHHRITAPAAAVVVFAKAPQPGRVKTRLCPPLTPEAAAELQRACLADLWERLDALPGVRRVLCHDPPESASLFRGLLGQETDLLVQSPGDLGQRLVAAFEALFALGLTMVALGADSPDLPLETVSEALNELAAGSCDIALGPAEDGGYTLIGMRQPHPELFDAIPWSSGDVFALTRERCRQSGLRVLALEPWYDVDDAASLARLRESARAHPNELPRLHWLLCMS